MMFPVQAQFLWTKVLLDICVDAGDDNTSDCSFPGRKTCSTSVSTRVTTAQMEKGTGHRKNFSAS
jgi:hypothetical protein